MDCGYPQVLEAVFELFAAGGENLLEHAVAGGAAAAGSGLLLQILDRFGVEHADRGIDFLRRDAQATADHVVTTAARSGLFHDGRGFHCEESRFGCPISHICIPMQSTWIENESQLH